MSSKWLSPKQVSGLIDRSVRTLYDWRKAGYGPQFFFMRGRIRYRQNDIMEWLDNQKGPK